MSLPVWYRIPSREGRGSPPGGGGSAGGGVLLLAFCHKWSSATSLLAFWQICPVPEVTEAHL